MNTPYIKEINGEITKDKPFLNNSPKKPNKRVFIYVIVSNGEKIKNRGNNRKNSSKRANKHSRLHQRYVG